MAKPLLFILPLVVALVGFGPRHCAESISVNPVRIENEWADFGVGDPFVLRHDGRYYLYASTPDHIQGIRCWSSDDLVVWAFEGLCADDSVSTGAYAPEVVYRNGIFYLYTSPRGQGHYVYTATSPTGPFERQTGNIRMSIDGSVFVDVDDSAYLTVASLFGVWMNEMESLLEPGPVQTVLTEASMGGTSRIGWTEGSMIIRRGPYYFLTYTGNHLESAGYRINYSWSRESPMGPYTTPDHNPILISTDPDYQGLGHSSTVLGPDLDSHYLFYHNRVPPSADQPPIRLMNMSRLVFNRSHMAVLGPTTRPMMSPAGPAWSTRQEGDTPESALSPMSLERRFTAEFNFRPGADPTAGKLVWGHRSASNHHALEIDRDRLVATYRHVLRGRVVEERTADLLPSFAPDALHTAVVIHAGRRTTVEMDGSPLFEIEGHAHGRIGVVTRAEGLAPSFVAVSRHAHGSSDRQAQHLLPGALEAVHGATSRTRTGTDLDEEVDYVVARQGVELRYDVDVTRDGLLAIDVVAAELEGLRGDVYVGHRWRGHFDIDSSEESAAGDAKWVRRRLATIPVSSGAGRLRIRLEGGSDAQLLRLITFSVAAEEDRPEDVEWTVAGADDFVRFATSGDRTWSDYRVEAEVDFAAIRNEIGLLFRATQESWHLLQVREAYLGYELTLNADATVSLIRNAYAERTKLGSATVDPGDGGPQSLSIEGADGLIRVRIGDAEVIRVYDPAGYRTGRVGVIAQDMSEEHVAEALGRIWISSR